MTLGTVRRALGTLCAAALVISPLAALAAGPPASAAPAVARTLHSSTPVSTHSAAQISAPPMGWNDWNAFGCNVSASLIESTAQAMVANGMAKAGYRYVNIDDCWMTGSEYPRSDPRRATAGRVDGHLVPDPTNFPQGIAPVAAYVHQLGLKLGIYESAGSTTCQGLAGSYGHELTDAEDFASWGVDYVKYDNCGLVAGTADNQPEYIARYKTMGDALRQASAETGHQIVYSVCEWGNYQPWTWAADQAEASLWRSTNDINDSWASTVALFEQNIALSKYGTKGAYNDPDMLEIGNGGQTDTEYRSQFSLWSMMAAPLISGTPIAAAGGKGPASKATLKIYENRGVIGVDQDALGRPAHVLSHHGDQWTLVRRLADGDKAVLMFNDSTAPVTQSVRLDKVFGRAAPDYYVVRDLWRHRTTSVAKVLRANVMPHGVAMFRVAGRHGTGAAGSRVTLSGTSSRAFVLAGQGAVLTQAVRDDGRRAITGVRVSISSLPGSWSAVTGHKAGSSVAAKSDTSATWRLHVPKGTAPGTYPITAVAHYHQGRASARSTSTTAIVVPPAPPRAGVEVSDLTPVSETGTVHRDFQTARSMSGTTEVPLTIAGVTHAKGLGVTSGTSVEYFLRGHCQTFSAVLGVDDHASTMNGTPTAQASVTADGRVLWQGTIAKGSAVPISAGISRAQTLELEVTPSTGFGTTPVDWADAQLSCS